MSHDYDLMRPSSPGRPHRRRDDKIFRHHPIHHADEAGLLITHVEDVDFRQRAEAFDNEGTCFRAIRAEVQDLRVSEQQLLSSPLSHLNDVRREFEDASGANVTTPHKRREGDRMRPAFRGRPTRQRQDTPPNFEDASRASAILRSCKAHPRFKTHSPREVSLAGGKKKH